MAVAILRPQRHIFRLEARMKSTEKWAFLFLSFFIEEERHITLKGGSPQDCTYLW